MAMARRPLLLLHEPGLDGSYLLPPLSRLDVEPIPFAYRDGGDIDAWVEDVEALRTSLGYEQLALFGHGLGGVVAQEYALHYADRLDRLMLCSTAATLDPLGPHREEALRALGPDYVDDEAFARLYRQLLPACFANPNPRVEAMLAPLGVHKRVFAGALAWLGSTAERLRQIVAPVLLVHGRYDWLISAEDGGHTVLELLEEGATLYVFERSGHFPFLEQAGPFVAAVSGWLALQDATPPLVS